MYGGKSSEQQTFTNFHYLGHFIFVMKALGLLLNNTYHILSAQEMFAIITYLPQIRVETRGK